MSRRRTQILADRNAFLTSIREAAARGRAHRVSINPEATHTAAYVGGGDDPVATFLSEWIAVGGRGQRVQGDDEARQFLSGFLETYPVANVIRWQHPQHGVIPPDQFIPLAEQTGLIKNLSKWVLNAALKQARDWLAKGVDVPIAVNLSMRDLHDPELPHTTSETFYSLTWLWLDRYLRP